MRAIAREIFTSSLEDCSIANRLAQVMRATGGTEGLQVGEYSLNFASLRRVRVLAVGKGANAMLQALLPYLPEHVDLQGLLISPIQPEDLPIRFQFFAGGHPKPNAASFAGARAAIAMLQAIPPSLTELPDTLCLFLVTGGASAMMELPLDPAIALEDTIVFHDALVNSGASIAEINCVRKHFSAVKGGRLAALANGAVCFSILVSDVPSGHPDAIGSGPAVPDTTTVEDCREVLMRYRLLERFPVSVQRFFMSANLPETPKPVELAARSLILLDATDLALAAVREAERLGFHAVLDNTCDDWDYRAAADYLLARVRALRQSYERVCVISVGEVTVQSDDPHLIGSATGGRNQQFALYAATRLEVSDTRLAILSAGSDGIDGNSAEAGAVVDDHTLCSAALRAAGQEALRRFSSTEFLQSVGCTIRTGPTGNNLRDLRLLLAE
ncbi:MAG: DUF4147 domain-containing protein [Acidobacteriaceae bacterium]